jgi:rod shape-determining protein MreD
MMRGHSTLLVLACYALGVLAEILPLPYVLMPFRPYVLAMFLVYWAIETPGRVGYGTAFALGLVADLCSASMLGEQALRLVLVLWIVQRFRARLRFFPLWQQAVAVGMILFVDRVVTALVHLAFGLPQAPTVGLFAPLIGVALWPWLYVLIDMARLRARERN